MSQNTIGEHIADVIGDIEYPYLRDENLCNMCERPSSHHDLIFHISNDICDMLSNCILRHFNFSLFLKYIFYKERILFFVLE